MVIPPIRGALVKSEDMLGPWRVWHAVNEIQSRFLADSSIQREELAHFSEKELRAWAAWTASELNAVLAKEGFSIRLNDFGCRELGVVSILDVLVDWIVEALAATFLVDQHEYSAVYMMPHVKTDQETVRTFSASTSSLHNHPIVAIATKSGDVLSMTIADCPYADFDLVSRIEAVRLAKRSARHASWLRFPMVDLNLETDISWLIGMRTVTASGEEAMISQALQQTKFKMNQFGARVKSAVAIIMRTISARVEVGYPIIIDKPFFLWIERPGMSSPLMYAYIDEQDWKDPGDLANM